MSDNIEDVDKIINEKLFECEFCGKILTTKSNLKFHQKTTKYCLKKQNKKADKLYTCKVCNKEYTVKDAWEKHEKTCVPLTKKEISKEFEKLQENYNEMIKNYEAKINDMNKNQENLKDLYELKISEYKERETDFKTQIKSLEDTISKIAINNIERIQTPIDIEVKSGLESDEDSDEIQEDNFKDISTLKITESYQIECREEDGFVNVTNLCKAGGKQFKHWNSLEKTKGFVRELSLSVGIPTSSLIQVGKSKINNAPEFTWVHPRIAINIAQWISPQFDVMVSGWVYEIMLSGRFDIRDTHSYRQLQNANNRLKLRVKHLENKTLKKQPRIQYTESNVMYIITNPHLQEEMTYILGIASNFTNRLSTYNKTEEHTVIYYQSCGSEEDMKLVEKLVFKKLGGYRKQANREIFQLNKGETVDVFINSIKKEILHLTL